MALFLFFSVLKKQRQKLILKTVYSINGEKRTSITFHFLHLTHRDLRDFAGFYNQSPLRAMCASTTVTCILLITRDPTEENVIVFVFVIPFFTLFGDDKRGVVPVVSLAIV